MVRLVELTNLVALAATIDVDGLKLGLGGNRHGGLELNAEIILLLLRSFTLLYYISGTYSPDITISGALTQIRGIFMLFLRFDKS